MAFWPDDAELGVERTQRTADLTGSGVTAAIFRVVMVSDGMGGMLPADGDEPLVSGLPAAVAPLDRREAMYRGNRDALSSWLIDLPGGTDVRLEDRIVLSDGRIFDVAGHDHGKARETGVTVIVVEVSGGG